jgi:hypothetical protein
MVSPDFTAFTASFAVASLERYSSSSTDMFGLSLAKYFYFNMASIFRG